MSHPLDAIQVIDTPLGPKKICRLDVLGDLSHLPYSIKILLESCLRNLDNYIVTQAHVDALKNYQATSVGEQEIAFKPGRVVLQDFTGVPAVVDLAAMRAAVVRMTGREDSADKVNPLVPCDLVIDHSVQVDAFASANACLTGVSPSMSSMKRSMDVVSAPTACIASRYNSKWLRDRPLGNLSLSSQCTMSFTNLRTSLSPMGRQGIRVQVISFCKDLRRDMKSQTA